MKDEYQVWYLKSFPSLLSPFGVSWSTLATLLLSDGNVTLNLLPNFFVKVAIFWVEPEKNFRLGFSSTSSSFASVKNGGFFKIMGMLH
jgi:hypothetical protein